MIEAGLARTTINQRIGRVVRLFKWAVENELIPPQVYQGLGCVVGLQRGRSGAREAEPVGPVEDARVEAVRPHVSRQVWAMVQLQHLTGMRPGEVTSMRRGDLDRSGEVWVYRPARHKTAYRGHGREVYLGRQAQEVLEPWLHREATAYLLSPREAVAERTGARDESVGSGGAATPAGSPRRSPGRAPGER